VTGTSNQFSFDNRIYWSGCANFWSDFASAGHLMRRWAGARPAPTPGYWEDTLAGWPAFSHKSCALSSAVSLNNR